jgi:hypothetical protein
MQMVARAIVFRVSPSRIDKALVRAAAHQAILKG